MNPTAIPKSMLATCGTCPARIVFALTKNGHLQPVDPEPAPGGNLDLHWGDDGRLHVHVILASQRSSRSDLHNPHHATCPNPAPFRKRQSARSRTNDQGGRT